MVQETILQHWVFTSFILPFLLIFAIVFGVLEKSKVFGSAKQLNAIIAFAIGLIFVSAISPKLVVANLILFLTVALVTMFVGLLLWGFVAGEDGLKYEDIPKGLKIFILVIIAVAVVSGLLWAGGVKWNLFGDSLDFLFNSNWSGEFWTNFFFVAVVIAAVSAVLKAGGSGKSSGKP